MIDGQSLQKSILENWSNVIVRKIAPPCPNLEHGQWSHWSALDALSRRKVVISQASFSRYLRTFEPLNYSLHHPCFMGTFLWQNKPRFFAWKTIARRVKNDEHETSIFELNNYFNVVWLRKSWLAPKKWDTRGLKS